jgi:hypothetical protein
VNGALNLDQATTDPYTHAVHTGVAQGLTSFGLPIAEFSAKAGGLQVFGSSSSILNPYISATFADVNEAITEAFNQHTTSFSRTQGNIYAGSSFVGEVGPYFISGPESLTTKLGSGINKLLASVVERFPSLGTDVGRWLGWGTTKEGFVPGELMPNGQIAGVGPGAMFSGEKPLPTVLYRGVGAGTKNDLQQAAGGAISPRGGGSTMIEHVNFNKTTSPYTSWTPDINVARERFANNSGVVFQVNVNDIPNVIIDTAPFTTKPSEQEFLIQGTVFGVKRVPN